MDEGLHDQTTLKLFASAFSSLLFTLLLLSISQQVLLKERNYPIYTRSIHKIA